MLIDRGQFIQSIDDYTRFGLLKNNSRFPFLNTPLRLQSPPTDLWESVKRKFIYKKRKRKINQYPAKHPLSWSFPKMLQNQEVCHQSQLNLTNRHDDIKNIIFIKSEAAHAG